MCETKLNLSYTCYFIHTHFENDANYVSLDYVEHATDHWSQDRVTSIEINKEKADEIIKFLKKIKWN